MADEDRWGRGGEASVAGIIEFYNSCEISECDFVQLRSFRCLSIDSQKQQPLSVNYINILSALGG